MTAAVTLYVHVCVCACVCLHVSISEMEACILFSVKIPMCEHHSSFDYFSFLQDTIRFNNITLIVIFWENTESVHSLEMPSPFRMS